MTGNLDPKHIKKPLSQNAVYFPDQCLDGL